MGEEGDRRGTGGTEILGEGERGRPKRYWQGRRSQETGEEGDRRGTGGTEIPGDGRGRPKRYWWD